MAKEDTITFTGTVIDVLPNTIFRIKINENTTIIAHMAGKLRKNNIRVALGDSVDVEMSPYDLTKGRITYRHRG